jgi:hypothetical protein
VVYRDLSAAEKDKTVAELVKMGNVVVDPTK